MEQGPVLSPPGLPSYPAVEGCAPDCIYPPTVPLVAHITLPPVAPPALERIVQVTPNAGEMYRGPDGTIYIVVPKPPPSPAAASQAPPSKVLGADSDGADDETKAAVCRAWVIFAVGCLTLVLLVLNLILLRKKATQQAFRAVYHATWVVLGVYLVTLVFAGVGVLL